MDTSVLVQNKIFISLCVCMCECACECVCICECVCMFLGWGRVNMLDEFGSVLHFGCFFTFRRFEICVFLVFFLFLLAKLSVFGMYSVAENVRY